MQVVVAEAFTDGRLTVDPSFSDLLNSDFPAAQAYKMAQAMMQLATSSSHWITPRQKDESFAL